MGDVQNLQGKEALDKIIDIAKSKMAMFCTFKDGKMKTRPMSTQEIDEQGDFWFFSQKDSHKNEELEKNPKVQLLYAEHDKNEYLSIEGRASIEYDKEKIDELWNMFLKTWFNEGKEDPKVTLIRVTPENGYYWDTKNNKMVSLAKIALGALTGKTMDDSLEGKLRP